jgi:desulfoferrodoxin-like iron-binding protein
MKTGDKYRCNICGQEIEITKGTSAEITLICCGEDMEKAE